MARIRTAGNLQILPVVLDFNERNPSVVHVKLKQYIGGKGGRL
jgi:hypothetical protein